MTAFGGYQSRQSVRPTRRRFLATFGGSSNLLNKISAPATVPRPRIFPRLRTQFPAPDGSYGFRIFRAFAQKMVAKRARAWDKTNRTSGMFETALPVPRLNDNNTGARPGCGGCQAAFVAEDRSRGGSTHLFFWRLRNQPGKTAIPGVPILPIRRIRDGFFYFSDAKSAPADSEILCRKPVRTGPGCPRFIL